MKKSVVGCGGLALGIVVLGAVVILGLVALSGYNRLVTLEEGVDAAWAQVENVYQRRADLIPNLVTTVKGAADFEQETLTAVVEARAKVGQTQINGPPTAEQLQSFEQAQGELTSALSRLLLVVERYPDIKATANFRDLQSQLEGTENRIAVERKRFTDASQAFNTHRRRFPTVLVANLLGFSAKPYFTATDGADRPPEVAF